MFSLSAAEYTVWAVAMAIRARWAVAKPDLTAFTIVDTRPVIEKAAKEAGMTAWPGIRFSRQNGLLITVMTTVIHLETSPNTTK